MTAQVDPGPFFFLASESTPAEVALAISDHWGVSVLVHESVAGKKVTGRLVTRTLDEALSGFSFLLGCKFRSDATGGTWMVGGEAVRSITYLPSYGLNASDVAGISREGARLVADRIVLEVDEGKTKELRAVVESFKVRPAMLVELFLLDVASSSVDRINAWLDEFRIAGGYVARAAIVASDPTGAVAGSMVTKVASPVYDVNVKGLLELIEKERSARVELRQQVQVLSGSETVFQSGEIIENQIITREPETGKDLVSGFERRTVGLQLKLRAVSTTAGWYFNVNLEDSNFVANRERSNKIVTERLMPPGGAMTLLASFTRKTDESIGQAVPILSSIPKLGRRLFTKKVSNSATRSLMLLAREIPIGR